MNIGKLGDIIEKYKEDFRSYGRGEKFMWEAVKCFQDNWNIDAEDFGEMFMRAIDGAEEFFAPSSDHTIKMILRLAEADDKATRELFKNLFDEDLDFIDRIKSFMESSENLRIKYDDGTWTDHAQYPDDITIYLWLKFPDKYYIHRSWVYEKCAQFLNYTNHREENDDVDIILDEFKMYDEIRFRLQSDNEIRQILDEELTYICYPDPKLVTTTINFAEYLEYNISNHFRDDPPVIDSTESNENSNNSPQYWTYAPGENASMWDEFYKKGIMGIGWDYLGDLRSYKKREAIMLQLYDPQSDTKPSNDVLATWQFAYEIKKGDIIFAKKGVSKLVGCGIVTSDYFYDHTRDSFNHVREVEWIRKGEWELPQRTAQKTLTNVTSLQTFVQKLLKILKLQDFFEADTEELVPYTKQDFLDEVFMTEPQYDTILSLLRCKKNIILQGAPGVGKTFTAKRLAYSVMGERDDSRIKFVQFHQSYSYEDFIMGYRPNENGGFVLKNGIFYDFCNRARRDSGRDYFFLIDEINRGNMSKIFGELLMLIEKDHRGEKAVLSYTGEEFFVPKNLYIIGMMNTADRSLAMIDYALRRRFGFYTIPPAFENAQNNGFSDFMKGTGCELYHKVVAKIKELNDAIRNDSALGKGFEIGHSYFVPEDVFKINDAWVRNVVRFEIIPLIEEYWFDDKDKCNEWQDKLYQAIGEKYDV